MGQCPIFYNNILLTKKYFVICLRVMKIENITLIDKILPIGGIVRDFPYVLVFKTTNWCWYKCPHCCENAGPDNSRAFIPIGIIKGYISQAMQDVKFNNSVIFTGGEIMAAYAFGATDYVPELLKFCLNHNIGTDIKTNAAWVNAKYAPRVFDDLSAASSIGKPYSFQISLSLDRYHKHSIQNCAKFIHELSKRPETHVVINLASFENDRHMFNDLFNTLKRNGTGIDDAIVISNGKQLKKYIAGDTLLLNTSVGTLFDGGRAKNIHGAYHDKTPQFSFISNDGDVLMAFDSFGRVTLGENSGRKINTKWRNNSGCPRALSDIRHRLISNAQFEDIRYRILTGKSFIKTR